MLHKFNIDIQDVFKQIFVNTRVPQKKFTGGTEMSVSYFECVRKLPKYQFVLWRKKWWPKHCYILNPDDVMMLDYNPSLSNQKLFVINISFWYTFSNRSLLLHWIWLAKGEHQSSLRILHTTTYQCNNKYSLKVYIK